MPVTGALKFDFGMYGPSRGGARTYMQVCTEHYSCVMWARAEREKSKNLEAFLDWVHRYEDQATQATAFKKAQAEKRALAVVEMSGCCHSESP